MLHGEYGFEGIYAGMPAVINNKGIKELVTYHLQADEIEKLRQSLEVLKGFAEE